MRTWTEAELRQIGAAEELRIAALRTDGTLRPPAIIWLVRVGDDLFRERARGRLVSGQPGPPRRLDRGRGN